MDYYQNTQNNQNQFNQQPAQPKKYSGFAIASMTCGIISLVLCCIGFSKIFGALAIIFAILNHRKGKAINEMCIAGIITGAIGVLLGLVISFFGEIMMKDPAYQQELYDNMERLYGEEFADYASELYEFDIE